MRASASEEDIVVLVKNYIYKCSTSKGEFECWGIQELTENLFILTMPVLAIYIHSSVYSIHYAHHVIVHVIYILCLLYYCWVMDVLYVAKQCRSIYYIFKNIYTCKNLKYIYIEGTAWCWS